MAETLKELRLLPLEEIISRHDSKAKHTVVGTKHYLTEIARRDQEKQTNAILKYIKWVAIMTSVITISTIINVIVAFR